MEVRSLLVSDLDGTLLGDEQALEQFARWYASRQAWLGLVYTSGRFHDSILESIATTHLPEPRAIISGVGTEIRLRPAAAALPTWPENRSQWRRDAVQRVMRRFEPTIIAQPDDAQAEFKASYFAYDAPEALLSKLAEELQSNGCSVSIVYSSRRDLDILPAGVDKGTSARYLAQHWGISSERVVVSGDSGNDAALFAQEFRGVIVANAQPEIWALRGPDIYHARRGFAAGVLEGLRYWGRDEPPAATPRERAKRESNAPGSVAPAG